MTREIHFEGRPNDTAAKPAIQHAFAAGQCAAAMLILGSKPSTKSRFITQSTPTLRDFVRGVGYAPLNL
jgi:hypothetical protein